MIETLQPLVSIVIPVYNGSNFMRIAIDSALNQTYKNIEVIVVNDGSVDSTDAIARSYGARIRYFSKTNGGVSSALNVAISNMKGQYFSWLSHDDVYYHEKIEKQISFVTKSENRTVVYSGSDLIDRKGNVIKQGMGTKSFEKPLVFQLLHDRFIGGCSLLIPKLAFDEVGMFDEELKAIQDYDMWFRMIKSNFEFKCLPIVTGATRIHSQQTSIAQQEMCAREDYVVYKDIISKMPISLLVGKNLRKNEVYYRLAYRYKTTGRHKLYMFCLNMGDEYNRGSANDFRLFLLKNKAKLYNKYLDPFVYSYWFHSKWRRTLDG